MPEYPWIIYRMSEGPLTTKEVHQGVNEQLNRKLGTDCGYSEYEWANLLQGFRPLPIKTASGSIAHFTDGADAVPFKSLTAQILPKQSGTGTPSPSNPRPISGTSVLNVERGGKNILNSNSEVVPHSTYGFFSLCPNNTPLTMTFFDNDTSVDISNVSFGFSRSLTENGAQSEISSGFVWTVNSGTITGRTDNIMSGNYCDQFVFFPKTQTTIEKIFQRFNIVVSVGTSTATTYEPYTGSTYTVNLGQTVYGGSADVVGGTGEKTHGIADLGDSSNNWSYVNGVFYSAPIYPVTYLATYNRIVCSCYKDVYVVTSAEMNNNEIRCYSNRLYIKDSRFSDVASFVAGITGEKVCYELATPTPFTFTGQPINSYLGVNNVWTDSGDVSVEYRSNF